MPMITGEQRRNLLGTAALGVAAAQLGSGRLRPGAATRE
jgi:hypothetical protein